MPSKRGSVEGRREKGEERREKGEGRREKVKVKMKERQVQAAAERWSQTHGRNRRQEVAGCDLARMAGRVRTERKRGTHPSMAGGAKRRSG